MGKAEPELLLQLSKRHPGATPKELLLPVKFRTPPAPLGQGGMAVKTVGRRIRVRRVFRVFWSDLVSDRVGRVLGFRGLQDI